MQDNVTKIGSILRAARETKGMTQGALAESIDKANRTVMDIENNKRFPAYKVLYKIIRTLDISADQIFWPEKAEYTPEQEQVIHEFLGCSDREQAIITETVRTLIRLLRKDDQRRT